MDPARTIVVYYSRTGTTAKVAKAIGGALGCGVEELVDTKKRAGFLNAVAGGKDAMFGNKTTIEPVKHDPGSFDLIVVGTPVWAFTMTPAVRAYLQAQSGRLPQVAFFLTTGGSGIERTFAHMQRACGKQPIATLALRDRVVRRDGHGEALARFVEQLRAASPAR